MKVVIALPDDKLEESIVNASCQYIIIICYQVFSHKINFFSNNSKPLANDL